MPKRDNRTLLWRLCRQPGGNRGAVFHVEMARRRVHAFLVSAIVRTVAALPSDDLRLQIAGRLCRNAGDVTFAAIIRAVALRTGRDVARRVA